jgi:hypothetical protein
MFDGRIPVAYQKMAPTMGPFLLHIVMMVMVMTVMNDHHAFRMSAAPAALSATTVI